MDDVLRRAILDLRESTPAGAIGLAQSDLDGQQDESLEAKRLVEHASGWLGSIPSLEARKLLNCLRDFAPVTLTPWLDCLEAHAIDSKTSTQSLEPESIEMWWAQSAPRLRRQLGIYHTPQPLVDHVWKSLEPSRWLEPQSGLILDPASGTNEFLRGALRVAVESQVALDAIKSLLNRWVGVEITFASWFVGWVALGVELVRLRLPLRLLETRPNLIWADATRLNLESVHLANDSKAFPDPRLIRQDFGWVLGNPPYSSRVERTSPGIERLLHGQIAGRGGDANYFAFRGEPLGERKTWLHDLYVRFFRLAQWWTAERDSACVAFITNRGWLENKTFRGMRESLASDFPRITVDVPHGSQASWFQVVTPLAIHYLSRSHALSSRESLQLRFRKVGWSQASSSPCLEVVDDYVSEPREPWFEFDPSVNVEPGNIRLLSHLSNQTRLVECGWYIPRIFGQVGSAIVTARDSLVVATTRSELDRRVMRLLDQSVSDDEIRREYFGRARSRKFQRGDTRSWQLSIIRERLRERWQSRVTSGQRHPWATSIVPCRYRALDDRFLLWDSDCVDWPRFDTQATLARGDWALIARRQSPVDRPADFTLVANKLVVDGVLRSDNRGNESVFTLHRVSKNADLSNASWESNLSEEWRVAFERVAPASTLMRLGIEVASLAYLYAILRTKSFQVEFHDLLVRDFPVVPLLSEPAQVEALIELGSRLLALHKSPTQCSAIESLVGDEKPTDFDSWTLGAHNVVGRWTRDRSDSARFSAVHDRRVQGLREVVRKTIEIQASLDRLIDSWGGWARLLESVVEPSKSPGHAETKWGETSVSNHSTS